MSQQVPYDFLIVGAGLYGAVFARELTDAGFRCLVIDRRDHIAGNVFSKSVDGIEVHQYGPHIFHTDDQDIWEYANRFSEFLPYTHRVAVNYNGTLYSFPLNLETFEQVLGLSTREEVEQYLKEVAGDTGPLPNDVKGWVISQVGEKLYSMFIEGYTRKQWGREPSELPRAIVQRLPIRFTKDDRYFNDAYQGIPAEGYTKWVSNMLEGIEVRLNTDFESLRPKWRDLASHMLFTGPIDGYFDYKLGTLEYRSLRFEHEHKDVQFYQSHTIVNYTGMEVPFTRIVEHKRFDSGNQQPYTIITREYPQEWSRGKEAYYPINDERNNTLYRSYKALAAEEKNILFGGRLAEYRYYDMHQVIGASLARSKRVIAELKQ